MKATKCSCGCNSCGDAPKLLNESVTVSEGLMHLITSKTPLTQEALYRYGSESHIRLLLEVSKLANSGMLQLGQSDRELFIEGDLGKVGLYEGRMVLLDFPFELNEAKHQGKDVELGKPKRGGPKKFYVYVRKPGGGIKKVAFGAKEGGGNLAVKINDPEARRAFAARHKCAQEKDRTSPNYWSCRLPRYAKALGLKSNFTGYW